ncbi:DUF6455 family protein [Sneathiella limimaris]|uniref:DUF6455 family protein n=1 Tax=Sneathiella limimaris TaxID=1964213 RepID=UPI00146CC647|nr:DUF6455 family protein [Sneathiella limimaris]
MFKKFDKHSKLFNQMSAAVDVELDRRVTHNPADASKIRSAVLKCMKCTHADECEDWISNHSEGAKAAPSYCLNRNFLGARESQ